MISLRVVTVAPQNHIYIYIHIYIHIRIHTQCHSSSAPISIIRRSCRGISHLKLLLMHGKQNSALYFALEMRPILREFLKH
jgi:hypothetical protein